MYPGMMCHTSNFVARNTSFQCVAQALLDIFTNFVIVQLFVGTFLPKLAFATLFDISVVPGIVRLKCALETLVIKIKVHLKFEQGAKSF